MDYNIIYNNHNLGIPPVFSSYKLKNKYYKWMKKQGLKIPMISAETYVRRILKELRLAIPDEIKFGKILPNPLITAGVWLYENTTLTQKEVSEIVGITTMTLENNFN